MSEHGVTRSGSRSAGRVQPGAQTHLLGSKSSPLGRRAGVAPSHTVLAWDRTQRWNPVYALGDGRYAVGRMYRSPGCWSDDRETAGEAPALRP